MFLKGSLSRIEWKMEQAIEVKRRFDDVYRTLLVIGPVLSFAFSNYAASNIFEQFVYDLGYPALMSSNISFGRSPIFLVSGGSTISN